MYFIIIVYETQSPLFSEKSNILLLTPLLFPEHYHLVAKKMLSTQVMCAWVTHMWLTRILSWLMIKCHWFPVSNYLDMRNKALVFAELGPKHAQLEGSGNPYKSAGATIISHLHV